MSSSRSSPSSPFTPSGDEEKQREDEEEGNDKEHGEDRNAEGKEPPQKLLECFLRNHVVPLVGPEVAALHTDSKTYRVFITSHSSTREIPDTTFITTIIYCVLDWSERLTTSFLSQTTAAGSRRVINERIGKVVQSM